MICPEWLPHIQSQFELLARQARSVVRFWEQMLHCPLTGDVEQNEVLLVDIFDMKLDTLAVAMLARYSVGPRSIADVILRASRFS
jgi:hypothetical protein